MTTKVQGAFRSKFSETVFEQRYAHEGCETWPKLARVVANDVCGGLLNQDEMDFLITAIENMWFIPGGRYLYYAGRKARFWNNCFLFKSEEDTREDWSFLAQKSTQSLMTGGGIGNDYSVYREKGRRLNRTGGVSSGPLPAMKMVNEIGRQVMQGGGRRSAIYASLAREHPDVFEFLMMKDWDNMLLPGGNGATMGDAKRENFHFPAPMDHTNISVNYGDQWLDLGIDPERSYLGAMEDHRLISARAKDPVFLSNCEMALRTGEPGFSFNFRHKSKETARNACTEVTSEDDCDVCNIGSLNLARIPDKATLERVTEIGIKFLLCGSIRSELPLDKIRTVRDKNRRLGLGIMGVHEWLLQRSYRYEVVPELKEWLQIYKDQSELSGNELADRLSVSRPIAFRAVAPTGTIGIVAGTTTSAEPLFAVAYLRKYLKELVQVGQYVIDPVAKAIIEDTGVDPESIETALDLAADPERRLKFQADIQDYVDMSISSTINLPKWGSDLNNQDHVEPFALLLAKYAPRLRGFTCYPDGARGGQPLTRVPYIEALSNEGEEVVSDICEISGKGGVCGA